VSFSYIVIEDFLEKGDRGSRESSAFYQDSLMPSKSNFDSLIKKKET
jgi:hypothetical protein